jgi:RNA polymerase sigma factor (sigma-70 family)
MASGRPFFSNPHQQMLTSADAVSDGAVADLFRLLDKRDRESARLLGLIQSRLFRSGLDWHDAEDVLMEAGLIAWQSLQKGNVIHNLPAFIMTISTRIIIGRTRIYQRQRQGISSSEIDIDTIPSLEILPINRIEQLEERALSLKALEAALEQIDLQDRELIELRYLQDMTWPQVQEYLAEKGSHIEIPTLRKRGSRALNRLRKILIDSQYSS